MITIGLVHYGDEAYYPLLKEWLRRYEASGCKLQVVVLSDLTARLPKGFHLWTPGNTDRFCYLRFDPTELAGILRPGKAFDTKGSIIVQASQTIRTPLLVLDTDAFFVQDPTEMLDKAPVAILGMGQDPIDRPIDGISDSVLEKNAGVLYFGTDLPEDRAWIKFAYIKWFKHLKNVNANSALLEQITWTAVWYELGKMNKNCAIPKALNWSYLWGYSNAQTRILHEHGPGKWARIPGAEKVDGKISPKYKNAYM